ncbi:MAG: tripartite tricarboxylate transporter substrate binding protein [Proteobacteria bacterium]|nr:tripartite tricarboxylate transporter substrate binding protein [Pseudomonadota bacterium]
MTPQKTIRRRVLGAACALAASGTFLVFAPAAHAQAAYPTKPVKLVVGFPPGGSNDIVARIISVPLGELLGQQVIVENKPGASGVLGSSFVSKAAPDGYTLLLSSASPLVIAPHLLSKKPFEVTKDFVAVGTLGSTPEAIAVGPSLQVKDFRDFMEQAKTKAITVSSSGNGGLPHLTIELLKQATGNKLSHVPYKGAGPAVTDTLAGHVNAVTMDLPALITFIREGKLKALAVTSERRVDFLPDVPTAQEQGLPSFSSVNWFGVFAPAGTAPGIVDKIHAALNKVVSDPKVVEQLTRAAVVPQSSASPKEFAAFVGKENERWGRVARESGATME